MKARIAVVMLALQVWLPAGAAGADSTDVEAALAAWARVLERHVDSLGRTAFDALAGDRADLDRVVAAVAAVDPQTHPALAGSPDAVLAWHINAYNALAMHGVIEEGIPADFNSFFKRAGFFKFRKVTIGGRQTSLYDYENKVIRPLDEPRVHFALNCMVRDCPRLPREPFLAATVQAQLEAATVEFFASDRHLRVDDAQRRIEVSAILDFYTRDFVASGRRDDLPGYINRYRESPLPADYRVHFMDYDWTVNRQP